MKLILIGYVILIICFIAIYCGPSVNKFYYKRYKTYEAKVDKKCQNIIKDIDIYTKEYYDNKLSRWQIVGHLNKTSRQLNSLYNSFRWGTGDEVTKELFTIKKQIILNYSELYRSRAKAISNGIKANEMEQYDYIKRLNDMYLEKDRLEKQKYKIPF